MSNNEIYRYIKTAYHLTDSDICQVFDLVNEKFTIYQVKSHYRNSDHKDYKPISSKKLKAFLFGLQRHLEIESTGMSVRSALDQLLSREGLQSTGDLVADAKLLRDKLSP